jgi:hypothetical protein
VIQLVDQLGKDDRGRENSRHLLDLRVRLPAGTGSSEIAA